MRNQPWFFAIAASTCLLAVACAPAESKNANDSADNALGISQGDDSLPKVTACINDKVPEARRAALHAEARQTFTTWKEAALQTESRATLPQACTIAQEQAKEEYAGFGCAM